jgi:hypothetical protein
MHTIRTPYTLIYVIVVICYLGTWVWVWASGHAPGSNSNLRHVCCERRAPLPPMLCLCRTSAAVVPACRLPLLPPSVLMLMFLSRAAHTPPPPPSASAALV